MTNLAEQLKAVDTQVAVIAAANPQKINGAVNPMAEMQAELARLKAENDGLRAEKAMKQSGTLTIRLSQKGAVSVYGLGRFPVTLHREQWEKLARIMDKILAYILSDPTEVLDEKDETGKATGRKITVKLSTKPVK
jgi:hypothetical protein